MTTPSFADRIAELERELAKAVRSCDFYRRRCQLLETWQKHMRDPERTIVCDILANGQMLPDPKGTRYGVVPVSTYADETGTYADTSQGYVAPAHAQGVPFKPETWPEDADGDRPRLCTVCGTPVRYGERHSRCA